MEQNMKFKINIIHKEIIKYDIEIWEMINNKIINIFPYYKFRF